MYLNFINQPDPAILQYSLKKIDLEDPDFLHDKSEDEYLEKEATSPSKPESSLPKPLGKKSKSTTKLKDEFQEFDDFLDKIETKKSKKKK